MWNTVYRHACYLQLFLKNRVYNTKFHDNSSSIYYLNQCESKNYLLMCLSNRSNVTLEHVQLHSSDVDFYTAHVPHNILKQKKNEAYL
jgi:hypothetical protein